MSSACVERLRGKRPCRVIEVNAALERLNRLFHVTAVPEDAVEDEMEEDGGSLPSVDDVPSMSDDMPSIGDDMPAMGGDMPSMGDDMPSMGEFRNSKSITRNFKSELILEIWCSVLTVLYRNQSQFLFPKRLKNIT